MKPPTWLRLTRASRRRSQPRTVTVWLEADTTRFVEAMNQAARATRKFATRIESAEYLRTCAAHERMRARVYLNGRLDQLCRDLGLDPIAAWRGPAALERMGRQGKP